MCRTFITSGAGSVRKRTAWAQVIGMKNAAFSPLSHWTLVSPGTDPRSRPFPVVVGKNSKQPRVEVAAEFVDRQSEDGVRACSRMLRFPLIFSFQARSSTTVRLRNPDHITANLGLRVNARLTPKLIIRNTMSQDDHSRVSREIRVEKFRRILLAFPLFSNIFEYQGNNRCQTPKTRERSRPPSGTTPSVVPSRSMDG